MTSAPGYSQGIDTERALKFAVQRIRGDRVQIIEGIIEPASPTWDHERAAKLVRRQIERRVVKRRRYAEYGAPLYLLVDRIDRSITLFSEPQKLGYTHVEGPYPFGAVVRLPQPFELDIDTSGLV